MRLLGPQASALPSLEAIRTELARRSLAEFVRQAWAIVEPTTELEWNWHLEAICLHVQALLEGRIPKRNLMINVPPGSMKSLIVSVFAPAWWLLHRPSWRAIFSSANPKVALRDSVRCREVIESDWYRHTFTPAWGLAADQNAKGLYKTTAQGFRMAVSASMKVVGERADALFMDDLLDATDALSTSAVARDAVNNWYDVAYANRLADPRTGIRCHIAQRLHENDPPGHQMAQGEWEVLSIPEVYRAPKDGVKPVTCIGWSDPRTVEGELLFPKRRNSAYLRAEKRRLGTPMFEAQHQQNPAPDSGIIFQRPWLMRRFQWPANHAAMPVSQLCQVLGIKRVVIGFDTALGEKQANDFTSYTVWGECAARYLVLAHAKDKRTAPQTKQWIVDLTARWRPAAVPVEGEGSSGGKAVVQMLREGTTVPAKEVPNISKVVRAQKVAATVEHSVWFPEGEPWVDELTDALCRFPKATHDDDVDGFCIGLEELVFGEATTGILDYYKQQAEAAARKAAG